MIHMKATELFVFLDQHFPNAAAVSWDNVGLLCGREEKEIHKVYIALDATSDVIEDAIQSNADVLLTHHPLIFSGIKRITEGDYLGERLIRLLENRITCYAMHTNYDIKRMADIVAKRMEMTDLEVLEATVPDGSEGIGYTGNLKNKVTLKEYALNLKKWFDIPDVRVYGNLDQMISRVAVCPGSAKGMEEYALAQNADVLIGGDFGHHEGLDCMEKGISVIDAGHYGLEHIFVQDIESLLKENFSGLEIMTASTHYPFQTL